ncbi:unnamed protein product [Cuscuta europaea]|uniref:DUF4283 domain-containing protein n=1 Tax=Cuscuta europaea TaxID=41803 RepID=A0A9P0YLD9_CUSEU|nr:unnamed protein product [Cuscuta europaea]
MNRVLDNVQWLFEQNMLVLRAIKPGGIPFNVSLDSVEFWVQVHNVSYSYANIGTAMRIGNYLGEFVRCDDNLFDEKWEVYMRVRVRMDIGKPLKIGTTIRKSKGEGNWVDFKI